MNVSFLNELLDQIVDRGRSLLDFSITGAGKADKLEELCEALLSVRGDASGVAMAQTILNTYRGLDDDGRLRFFTFLAARFEPNAENVAARARAYLDAPGPDTLETLAAETRAPRLEFFRRLNLAPGGTAKIVALRADLLDALRDNPQLKPVDRDLVHLFGSWFNRGFLVLRPIDWTTPAAILEKIIEYEAVHEIRGWDDLKRRLKPADRRCFGFFHPSPIDEPLIFVEVALMREMPESIQGLLDEKERASRKAPNTAVFYSISNCQKGLAGISFGSFLIKQVANDQAAEIGTLNTFVTLSPVPGFARWLSAERGDENGMLTDDQRAALTALDTPGWAQDRETADALRPLMTGLCAHFLTRVKGRGDRPADPVARFHLGNGARLERVNWLADIAERGLEQAHSLMVNYLYDLKEIETNHEAFANTGEVAVASAVAKQARAVRKERAAASA